MDIESLYQYDLTVLKVDLDRRGRRVDEGSLAPAVVFEVWRGSDEPLVLARVIPPKALFGENGGKRQLGENDSDDLLLGLVPPPEVLSAPALTSLAAEGRPIWLDLPATAGPLRLMPWERLLEPLGVPVLRLPSLTLPPRPPSPGLEVALCASSIGTEEADGWAESVARLVEALRSAPSRPVSVHVFTNAFHVPRLRESLGRDANVAIHDPRRDEAVTTSRERPRGAAVAVENPWLLWMEKRLRGIAVDHVHWLCHGDFVLDHGTLALASTPWSVDDEYRCAAAPEVLALLLGLGAWSVGLSGPIGNLSPRGLRDVAYCISDARPSPVVHHETGGDTSFAELTEAFALTWNDALSPAPRCTSTAVWADPASVRPSLSAGASITSAKSDEAPGAWAPLLTSAIGAALSSTSTPTWVASTARVLEQAHAQWLAGPPGSPGRGHSPAPVDALRFVTGLLEKHISEAGESGRSGHRAP